MRVDNPVLKEGGGSAPPVLDIEVLALDLSRCARCAGTLDNIHKAIEIIRPALEAMEGRVNLRKIVIGTEEEARRHRFAASPTVRVNGRDIALETLESECEDCSGLCGCDGGMNCRVWRYRGAEHAEAPVGLIVESILREIFACGRGPAEGAPAYNEVPENLRRFFRSRSDARTGAASCCSPAGEEPRRKPGGP